MIIHPVVAAIIFVVGGTGAVVTYVLFDRASEMRADIRKTEPWEWLPASPFEGPPVPRIVVKNPDLARKLLSEAVRPYWIPKEE